MRESLNQQLDQLVDLITAKVAGAKSPDTPYVGLEHMAQNGSHLVGRGSASDSTSTNGVFRAGDVLFGKLRPQLRKCVWATFDGYCSTDILILRPRVGVDPGFAFRAVGSEPVFAEAIRREEGTKMPRTSWKHIRRVAVFAAQDEHEQSRIAEILTTVDKQIQATAALIAKYQSIKKGLIHDLFSRGIDEHGCLRPTRDEAPFLYKDTRFGPLPIDWQVCPMSGVSSLVTDGAHQSVATSEDGIPFLYVSCVREDRILWDNAARISPAVYRVISRGREPSLGSVLYTAVGSYGIAAAVQTDQPFSFQRHIAFIRPNCAEVSGEFLALWLNHPWARNHADAVAVGNAQKTITLGELKRFPVIKPKPEEQDRIVVRVAASESLCRSEENRLTKLRSIKLGLMCDLLTGNVRVTPAVGDGVTFESTTTEAIHA